MNGLRITAPSGSAVTRYDRGNLSLYAAMLDADESGLSWRDSSQSIMGIDPNASYAEACWKSHLDRARWIVGDGLPSAISAFQTSPARCSK
jgi:hypothetical protein